MRWLVPTLALLVALAGCAEPAGRSAGWPSYENPVLDSDFPDPAVLRAADGWFYVYATQSEHEGRMLNIQVARSRDLIAWERLGDALPVKPQWASRTQDFWAPHVAEHDGRYFLYYSAKPDAALTDTSRGLCLAVATSDRPGGPFTDVGTPLQCGEGFVNIDPMAFDDPASGRRLLYWGSGFRPIKVRELAPDRISFAPGSREIELIPAVAADDPGNYQRLVEGAWVVRRDGWYWLFYSGDNCCGPEAHYAVMVARSRSATGPFESLGRTGSAPSRPILARRGVWVAPGHNSIVEDARGQLWMLYHAVDSRRPRVREADQVNTRRVMLLDPIVWRGGWPRVEGDGPSSGPNRRPAFRRLAF
jgi:arabinan endo-1,5-alpha-L-arabinosidase